MSFDAFYANYRGQHSTFGCRALHLVGNVVAAASVAYAAATGSWLVAPAGLVAGYACGVAGHLLCERNLPAPFKTPLDTLLGNLRMCAEFVTGK